MIVEFSVPGLPVAKERPRASSRGGAVRMYTPPKTVRYEKSVRDCARAAMQGRAPVAEPLVLDVLVHLTPPASWSARRRAQAVAGVYVPTKKPDLSNVLKAIEDGMNGVVYQDDAAIVDGWMSKRYAEVPGVFVRVSRLANAEAAPR